MKSKPLFFLLIAVLCLFSACSCVEGQSISAGSLAPDFTIEGLSGEKIVLSEVWKDKILILGFWATWCPFCIKAIPELKRLYAENKQRLTVIGINVGEHKAKVKKFAQKVKISYPIAQDPKGRVAQLYQVVGIPTLVAIDKNGQILYYGYSVEEMAKKIKF